MKSTIRSITAVGAFFLVSAVGACAADWTTNLYVSTDVGGTFQQEATVRQSIPIVQLPGTYTASATFNPGTRSDITVGYSFNQSCAVELESGFMWNHVDTFNAIDNSGPVIEQENQNVNIYSVPILVNLVYKFPTKGALKPYFGAGVGANIGIFAGHNPWGENLHDTELTCAYQAEVGLKYALSKNACVGLAYKFFGTTEQNYYFNGQPNLAWPEHLNFSEVYIHGIFANFTWNF